MKIKECIEAAALLKTAKVTKMEDADKLTVVKAMRALKQVASEYESLYNDMQEKLKCDGHNDMVSRAKLFNERYAQKPYNELDEWQRKEREELSAYFSDYNNRLAAAMKEEEDKEVSPEYKRLTEDAFGKLIASNDFSVEQILNLETVLV